MKGGKINRTLIVIAAVCLVSIAGYFVLPIIIQKKIGQQLKDISPALQIKYSKFHTNLFSASISFDSLAIHFIPYSSRRQNEHQFFFSKASLKGISILKYLFSKKINAPLLLLDEGNIQLDSFLLNKKDSAQSEVFRQFKWPFKKFSIENIELKKTNVFLKTSDDNHLLATTEMFFNKMSVNQQEDVPTFENFGIHLFDLNYSLREYKFRAKQLLIDSRKKLFEADSLYLIAANRGRAEISSLTMSGFEVMKLMSEKVLSAKKLIVGESKISITRTEKMDVSFQSLPFKKVHIDETQLNSFFFAYMDKANQFRFNVNMKLEGIDTDSSFDMQNLHFADIHASLSNFHFSGNNYHHADIKTIDIDSKKQLIKAKGINITPTLGKYEYQEELNHQADWVQAHVSEVQILRPDLHRLFQKKLFASEIKIGESKVYIFRDRRLPRQQKDIPLPVDYLKSLPVECRVKRCELATSAIAYEEFPKAGYGKTGILKIEKMRVDFSPLINHPLPSDPAYITMNVEGSIMGSGTTHAIGLMPLQNNKAYHIKGSIEKLELTKLNSSSENLGKIRIKSGFLDFLSFDFTMTEQRSTGKIVGAYHHLIIQQLKKHTRRKNVADFASFALRHAIIPLNKDSSIPERKRTGKVDYQRDPTRMVSYYFLQSLLTGVKKSFTLGFLLPK